MSKGISIRAYAKRRGCSDKAVRKAIADGRIKAAQLPDKSIDPDLADDLWERNTDAVQRRGKEAKRAAETQRKLAETKRADPGPQPGSAPDQLGPQVADPKTNRSASGNVVQLRLAEHTKTNRDRNAGRPSWRGGDEGDGDSPEMMELNAEEKEEKIRRLRIANDKAEGQLILREPVLAHVMASHKARTEAWERWPDKVGPECADRFEIQDVHGFLIWLRDAVREELNDQAGTSDADRI